LRDEEYCEIRATGNDHVASIDGAGDDRPGFARIDTRTSIDGPRSLVTLVDTVQQSRTYPQLESSVTDYPVQ
jgi:hypothetical protein